MLDPKSAILLYHRGDHYGPPIALDEYLQRTTDRLISVNFPMGIASNQTFKVSFYENGELKYSKEKKIDRKQDWAWRGDSSKDVVLELKNQADALISILKLTGFGRHKYDLGIGIDPLCVYHASILKKFGIVNKVVYSNYNDVTPLRSEKKLFNSIYTYVLKYALKNADYVWYRWSNHREEVIKKYGQITEKNVVMVPMGVYIRNPGTKTVYRNRIVSAREVTETAGLHLLIDAMPEILAKIPDVEFVIVGEGPYLPALRQLAKERNVEDQVKFLGRRPHDETLSIIESSGIGLATYLPTVFRTRMETNSKIESLGATISTMEMIAAGLPMIVTKGMGISYEVEIEKAGIVIDWDKKQICDAVVSLLTDRKKYDFISANAKALGTKYEWRNIFHAALRGESTIMRTSS